jgi:predicted Zn-dependent protease
VRYVMLIMLTACSDEAVHLVSQASQKAVLDPYLKEVAAGINAAVGCAAVQVNTPGYVGITFTVSEQSLVVKESALGEENSVSDSIELDPVIFNYHDVAIGVITHEIGHAAGLGHTPGTIMSAVYSYGWTPEAAYESFADLLKTHNIYLCHTKGMSQ